MAGVTGKAQIDQAVERYLAASRYTLQERKGVIAGSVENITLPENSGPAVNIPKFGQVSTYALTEGVDMTQAQQITDTAMTLTPAEYGAQVVLTDLMMMTVRDEFFAVAGRVLADSFDRQREQTLADDFDSFSNAQSAAATALGIGNVMGAHAAIKYGNPAAGAGRGGEPGPDPISGVFTPAQIHGLKKTMSIAYRLDDATTSSPLLERPDAARYSMEFDAAGTTIKQSVNINKDGSDDAKGAVFSKQATILVELGPQPKGERERDASLRGWEVNFVGRWARGEYNDSWGVEMLYDSVSPTS